MLSFTNYSVDFFNLNHKRIMRYFLFQFIIVFLFVSCKKVENSTQDINPANKDEILNSKIDTLKILDENSIIIWSPNKEEINVLKTEKGEDFYIIADDVNSYIANISEELKLRKIKYIDTDAHIICFKNKNIFLDKSNFKNKWNIVYISNNKIKVDSPIDFNANNLTSNFYSNESNYDENRCVYFVGKIVKKGKWQSNYPNIKEAGYDFFIDKATKKEILVKVTSKDKDDPIVIWLRIDLEKNLLKDITKDDVEPTFIENIDEDLLVEFKSSCLKYCLD